MTRMSTRRILIISTLMAAFSAIGIAWFHQAGHTDHSASAKPPYVLSDYTIQLERTPCFGSCPVFHLTVHPDGRTLLVVPASRSHQAGGDNSGIQDIQFSSKVDRRTQGRLIDTLEKGRYWKLHADYFRGVTDHAGARIEVTTPQRSWPVSVYAVPCVSDQRKTVLDKSDERVPDVFCDLARQLDEVACGTLAQGVMSSPDAALVPTWPPHCETAP